MVDDASRKCEHLEALYNKRLQLIATFNGRQLATVNVACVLLASVALSADRMHTVFPGLLGMILIELVFVIAIFGSWIVWSYEREIGTSRRVVCKLDERFEDALLRVQVEAVGKSKMNRFTLSLEFAPFVLTIVLLVGAVYSALYVALGFELL